MKQVGWHRDTVCWMVGRMIEAQAEVNLAATQPSLSKKRVRGGKRGKGCEGGLEGERGERRFIALKGVSWSGREKEKMGGMGGV